MASRLVLHHVNTGSITDKAQNKQLDTVKAKASPATSRASSVTSTGSAGKGKAKGKKK
jgi:hypothetical protein